MSSEPTKPEPPRCSEHGLVTGPDGSCVLCRRASPAPPPATTQQARSSVLPIVAAVVLVLAAAGAFALYRLRSNANTPSASAPTSEPAVRLLAKEDRPRDQGADRPPMTVRLRTRTPPPGPPLPSAPPMVRRIAPPPTPPAPAPSSVDKDEQEALAARARMNQMYARAARQSGDKQVQIIMYMTSWWPACRKAGRWLRQNNFSFSEIDLERTPGAREAMRRANPRGGIPTFLIDGQVKVGFSARGLRAVIQRAARRRSARGGWRSQSPPLIG